jgi:nicotinamidase-related amidase
MELGYHVTLVKDGTAAFNPEGMVAAATNAPMFAHAILSTVDLLERFPTDQHPTSWPIHSRGRRMAGKF